MSFNTQRGLEELEPFYADMGEEGVKDFWRRKNTESIDGFDTGIFGT